jgi:hypothetical protein
MGATEPGVPRQASGHGRDGLVPERAEASTTRATARGMMAIIRCAGNKLKHETEPYGIVPTGFLYLSTGVSKDWRESL